MTLNFRKKSYAEWLTLFVLAMPFAFFLLVDFLRLPSFIKYTVDVAWLGLLLQMLLNRHSEMSAYMQKLAVIVGLFFAATLIGFALNYQSPLYYLWGLRNNVRFFVFFFACVVFLKDYSINYYLRFFDTLFWINVPLVLFQYFIMGKTQDHLGGLFGVEKGCNAYMAIFLVIIVAKSLLFCLNLRERVGVCLTKCIVSLLIAALSELKFFFVAFVVVVVMAINLTGFTYRKLWITITSILGVWITIQVLIALFPGYAKWFNIESMWNTITSSSGYTASGDMNRLTTISVALEHFLPSASDKLFGLGLGNCDYASFDFLVTPFYRMYRGLHYAWFSSAFLMLETGFVGLILYTMFFVFVFFLAGKRKKAGDSNPLYCQLAQIMAVMSVIMVVYNASMRTEAAYMMFFVLALPFVSYKNTEDFM